MVDRTVRLGPWPGGLNLRDAQNANDQVGSAQLRDLLNLDVQESGVLLPRRGARMTGSPAMYSAIGVGGRFSLLGSIDAGATARSALVAALGNTDSAFYYSSRGYSVSPAFWALVPGGPVGGAFTTAVQYADRVYIVVQDTIGGAYTGQYRASLSSGTWTAVPTMPAGDEAFMVRERMFIINRAASRIYWSKPTDPTVWAAPDGGSADVNPGDGSSLQAYAVVNSQIYLFKRGKTYLFTFSADPALDGQLTLINDRLGAYSAVAADNGVLLVNDLGVYRLLNNYFSRVDEAAPVDTLRLTDNSAPAPALAIEGDQVVIGPSASPSAPYSHLAMNLRTGAWSGRSYPDPLIGPLRPRQITSQDADGGGGGAFPADTTVLYGHQTRWLTAVRIAPNALRAQHTLDVTSTSAVISPAYRMATGEMDGGDYFTWKQLRWAAARLRVALPAGDAAVMLQQFLGPDFVTPAQSVQQPAGTATGGKAALARRRWRSLSLGLSKAQTTLSPTITDPTTSSELWVRYLQATLGPEEGSVTS